MSDGQGQKPVRRKSGKSRQDTDKSWTDLDREMAVKRYQLVQQKRKAKQDEIFKSLSVVIGFVVMSMLAFWV